MSMAKYLFAPPKDFYQPVDRQIPVVEPAEEVVYT
jgi:hypothetical protein